MDNFKYFRASDVKEACSLLSRYGEEAKILSGGQSLVSMMKQRFIMPSYIIDVKGISELDYIRLVDDGGLEIGAMTTHRSLEKSAVIRENFSMLSNMELTLASMAVRNWGTVGGSLCSADPASDLAPSLIALGAQVTLSSENGERVVLLEDFIVDSFETILKENELLTQIQVPGKAALGCGIHTKFARRAHDLGIASVATHLILDKSDRDICNHIRIVLGAVDPFPQRYKRAEGLIRENKINEALIEEAARAVFEDCNPTTDINGTEEYKREIARVLVIRTVKEAIARARSV